MGDAVTPPTSRGPGLAAAQRASLAAIFLVGLVIPLVMANRCQIGGDQLHFLARGWLLAERGHWIQVGMPTSALGDAPGGLTALLAGAPLLVWRDYRAPVLLILLTHVVAYLLLDRALRPLLRPRERILFAVFYWLNPWRIHFSGFLWDPNYAFLFGAVHTWAILGQRERPSFWLSFWHALAIGAFMQVHSSFALLVIASAVLLLRGYFRPHWGGVAAACAIVAASLVPWAAQAIADPAIIPGGKGFIGRGLLLVYPLLRGVYYWLRYVSFELSDMMTPFDFSATLPRLLNGVFSRAFWVLEQVIGPVTVLFPIAANIWLWQREHVHLSVRPDPRRHPRQWLVGYVAWSFLAAMIAFALSPTTFMAWQALCVLHIAVLPPVLWLAALGRTRLAPRARLAARAWAAVALTMAVGMAFGSPMFRRGGKNAVAAVVKADLPMLHDLGIVGRCEVRVDRMRGWLPDVFLPHLGADRWRMAPTGHGR
ncbi:MAG: hypothetical protein ACM3O7_09865 [Acidobacteriota bacterium]